MTHHVTFPTLSLVYIPVGVGFCSLSFSPISCSDFNTLIYKQLFLVTRTAIHTGQKGLRALREEVRLREKQEIEGSLDSVQQATQASGH